MGILSFLGHDPDGDEDRAAGSCYGQHEATRLLENHLDAPSHEEITRRAMLSANLRGMGGKRADRYVAAYCSQFRQSMTERK